MCHEGLNAAPQELDEARRALWQINNEDESDADKSPHRFTTRAKR
jgi:hypothetical protein